MARAIQFLFQQRNAYNPLEDELKWTEKSKNDNNNNKTDERRPMQMKVMDIWNDPLP